LQSHSVPLLKAKTLRYALLLFRTGNDYRIFGRDANTVSRILGTTLTQSNGTETTGFPVGALDTSLPLLVRAGQRVAIADETETTKIERKREAERLPDPRPYSGALAEHHKQGSLVVEKNGQTGFLKERYRNDAVFKSLELNPLQTQKATLYIQLRDTYHT
jgi:DNA mismatch repair ATPase MutS